MRIAIITGSHRVESESSRAGHFIEKSLKGLGVETFFLDLGKSPLPFWDEGIWDGKGAAMEAWKPVKQELATCDAIVVIAPEWGGMVPAALKNFFLYATDGSLYHKPGLIVGLSASRNGAYPVAELRMSGYKNTHVQFITEHVIIRNAGEMLKGDAPANKDEEFLRKRIDYGLKVLIEYAKALKLVRESGILNRKEFANGM